MADHLGEGKLLFQTITVLQNYHPVENTSDDNLKEKSRVDPLKVFWCQTLASLW